MAPYVNDVMCIRYIVCLDWRINQQLTFGRSAWCFTEATKAIACLPPCPRSSPPLKCSSRNLQLPHRMAFIKYKKYDIIQDARLVQCNDFLNNVLATRFRHLWKECQKSGSINQFQNGWKYLISFKSAVGDYILFPKCQWPSFVSTSLPHFFQLPRKLRK